MIPNASIAKEETKKAHEKKQIEKAAHANWEAGIIKKIESNTDFELRGAQINRALEKIGERIDKAIKNGECRIREKITSSDYPNAFYKKQLTCVVANRCQNILMAKGYTVEFKLVEGEIVYPCNISSLTEFCFDITVSWYT